MAEPGEDAILIIHVHDRPGALAKIAAMFHRRGLNIRTLTVAPAHEPELSKLVVRVSGPEDELERLAAALGNLVDVLAVARPPIGAARAQELCLARVAAADGPGRAALLAATAPFQAALIDAAPDSVVLEAAGTPSAIELFVEVLRPFGLLDLSRTGVTTMPGRTPPSLGDRSGPATSAQRREAENTVAETGP
jgi:acetolactate synthase I/III small subunit